jgi:tetratricopeptide (TPR) repeat protein
MSFDQLPQIDRARIQSSESALALESVFRLPKFVTRVQNPDLGVDYVIELAEVSQGSNIHFSVQLKSVELGEREPNGQFLKFVIETSRLHYLSRTLCGSLLVIYDASKLQMYHRWVHEIVPELDSKGTAWRAQKSVTIRIPLSNILNTAAAEAIHDYVSCFYEQIQSSIVGAGLIPPMESAGVSAAQKADFKTKTPGSENFLEDLLLSGLGLVSEGLYRQVIEAYSRTPSAEWSNNPKHLLTIAYAYEHAGQPLQALTYSKAALSFSEDAKLPQSDASFAELIHLNSRYEIGLLDQEQYLAELSAFIERYPNSVESNHCRLELIHRDVLTNRKSGVMHDDPIQQLEALYEQAKRLVKAVDGPYTTDDQWGLHFWLARIEFQIRHKILIDANFRINAAENMGYPVPLTERMAMVEQVLPIAKAAFDRLERLQATAKTANRPDLYAICNCELASHQLYSSVASHLQAGKGQMGSTPEQTAALEACLKLANDAIQIFAQLENERLKTRGARLKAEILNALGRHEQALNLIDILREDMGRAGFNPGIAQLTELPSRPSASDTKEILDDASDVDLERYARDTIRALRIPQERINNVLKDFKSLRTIRAEQRSWCKHIDLIQALGHTASRETVYSIDPNRHCRCVRYSYESLIGSNDFEAVISAFKVTHCAGCTGREI